MWKQVVISCECNQTRMEGNTQRFIQKAQRKQLRERAYLKEKSNNKPYFQYRWGTPTDDKCIGCGEKEDRLHCCISCKKTHDIRKKTFQRVANIIRIHTGIQGDHIPNWFNGIKGPLHELKPADQIGAITRELMEFNKVWGTLGISIPNSLKVFIKVNRMKQPGSKAEKEKDMKVMLEQIHLCIVKGAHQCWIERCKNAAKVEKSREALEQRRKQKEELKRISTEKKRKAREEEDQEGNNQVEQEGKQNQTEERKPGEQTNKKKGKKQKNRRKRKNSQG
jgi:hypothetical protein